MPNRQSMSIVQALLTSLCARGWSVTVNQADVQHVVSWVSPCVPGLSDSRTSVKANQEVVAYRGRVATDPIQEGHANGRTFTEDRNTVCRRWNRLASCGGFSRMYPSSPSSSPTVLIKHAPAHPLADVMTWLRSVYPNLWTYCRIVSRNVPANEYESNS